RDENGDGRQRVALHQALEILVLREPRLLPDLGNREDEQDRVEGVQHQEIDQDREIGRGDDRGEHAHVANSASACSGSPSTILAMAPANGLAPVSASSRALRPWPPKRIRASAARSRTHHTLSCSAAVTSGSVPASAIMPSERTAWARTAQASSATRRVSAA